MSATSSFDRILRRLVVALGAHPQDEAALTFGAQLARRLDAELSGLFIEDSELLEIAALPVTSLLVHHTLQRRTFGAREVEYCFRAEEQRLRRLMAAISERHRIRRWSFDVRRGHGSEELARDLGPDDLLVISPRTREDRRRRLEEVLARETAHATLILPPVRRILHRHVSVLLEDGNAALSAGARLAGALDARLSVIPVAAGDGVSPEDKRALREKVKALGRPVHISASVKGDAEGLRAALDLLAADIVTICRPGRVLPSLGTDDLHAVIGARAVLIAGH